MVVPKSKKAGLEGVNAISNVQLLGSRIPMDAKVTEYLNDRKVSIPNSVSVSRDR